MQEEGNTTGENGQGTVTDEQKAAAEVETTAAQDGSGTNPEGGADKTLTQSQVNDIVRDRLAQREKAFYDRYGVSDEAGMDDLVGKAQFYDTLKAKNDEYESKIAELTEKLAFLSNNIDPERYDDVRTWFKGKGEPLTDIALKDAIVKHAEWLNREQKAQAETPKTAPIVVGEDAGHRVQQSNEEIAANLFGLKHFVK